MKQLFVFALLLSNCCLFSQDYKPMAVEGATWVYAEYYYNNVIYSGHQIKGNSMIDGIEYKVIYDLDIGRDENDSIVYTLKTNFPLAFVRDDIEEKKVYIIYTEYAQKPNYILCQEYDFDNMNEYLLYDFSVEIGDYEEGCSAYSYSYPLMNITNVDTFGFNVLKYNYQEYNGNVLEQTGSLGGFFWDRTPIFTVGAIEILSYCINDEPGCPYYLGPLSNEEITKNDQIKVYPNPSDSYFHIESEEDKIETLTIYTLTGQKVYSLTEIGNTLVDVDVNDLTVSENLFVIIELENGTLTRKHLVRNR